MNKINIFKDRQTDRHLDLDLDLDLEEIVYN